VLQHLEESATLLIVNAVPIYDNNVWGASIQKGVAKRKKEARPRTNLGLVSLFWSFHCHPTYCWERWKSATT